MPATSLRFLTNLKASHRRKTLEGRPHLVVPATILGEAVITGEGAGAVPLLYTNSENEKSAAAWNHMPVVVYHPKDEGGFVSARTPEWLDARKVGVLLNTKHDGSLKTQCWLDEARTKQIDKRVYDAVMANKALEVSTGLGAEIDWTAGEHGGVKYKGIPRDYRPDHLAILPDKVGAFSIAMGGGLFANQLARQPESVSNPLLRAAADALAAIGVVQLNNELSFGDKSMALSELLSSRFGERGKYWSGYLCELYDDYLIFSDGNGKRYKIGYSMAGDVPSLESGKPTEVVRAIVYRTPGGELIGNQTPATPLPAKESEMADRKTRIDALIANSKATEADRPSLLSLSDAVFNAAFPEAASPPPATPVVTQANAAPLDIEAWKRTQPPEVVQMYNQGEKARKQRVDLLVNQIMKKPDGTANPACKFAEVTLRNMDVDDLAAMAELAKASHGPAAPVGGGRYVNGFDPNLVDDYSGAAGAAVIANQAAVDVPKEGLTVPRLNFGSRTQKAAS